MSIQVVCPNGHVLKVPDDYAGKAGLCPVCKAKVKVPVPKGKISEDAILDILAADAAKVKSQKLDTSDLEPDGVRRGGKVEAMPRKKKCPRCNAAIPADIKICPNCRTYVGGLTEEI